jgi:hypothetical protein
MGATITREELDREYADQIPGDGTPDDVTVGEG